jgi:ABC-type multidrug transport system fused ATPase/permease subunit
MLNAVKASLWFMSPEERRTWYFLTILRAALSLSDLVVILAIGFVATSTALFLTEGSDPNRILDFAGFSFPAVNAQTLPWVAGSVFTLFLLKAFASLLLTKRAAFFVAKIEARAAKAVAEIVFGGDLSHVQKKSREEMMFAIQSGSPAAFNVLLNAANTFVTEATLFTLITLGFLVVDPWVTLAALLYFGLIAVTIQYFVGSQMTKAGTKLASSSVKANTAISDLTSVFRELSVLGLRYKYIDRIYQSRVSASNSAATNYYLNGMPRYIIEAALLVGVGLFVLLQSLSGDIVQSAGTLGVFLAGGFRLTAALLPLQSALLTMNSTIPSAKTAHDILLESGNHRGLVAETSDNESTIDLRTRPLGVSFNGVSFKYPDAEERSIFDVSLEISPGTQVAFIGASGAGKSTIADLICGVLKATAGEVKLLSNEDQSQATSKPRISYVPQNPGIVSGSILDNIALAVDDNQVDRKKVLAAVREAHLAPVVDELPDGLDHNLGKLKDGLSGGQMQRIGLARALYTSPGLLVMDEATSALDADSELEIQRALQGIRGSVTVVLIAHRLNTIQHADQVFLIEKGRVVDSGTFQELVARNPSVERLVKLMNVSETEAR